MITLKRKFPTMKDLAWIDGFVANIRPHVFVRERDSLLIMMPNQAYRLNPTGLRLLKAALDGKPIAKVLDSALHRKARTPDILRDVHNFFCDVRALVMGCIYEGHGRPAVEREPFSRDPDALPVLSEIAVTYKCNLACRFCYAGCNCTSKPVEHELTTDEAKQVLHKIRHEAEVPSVSFTGGEPLLRDDTCELIEYATKTGLRVNLITNGTLLTGELAGKLKESGLRSAQVSLEGPDAEAHDYLTQTPGSFEATLAGIEALRAHDIYVHTNTTINRVNAGRLTRIVDLAASLELPRLSMNMVMPCGTAGTGETSLKYSEVGPLVLEVKKHARRRGIEFMWYSPTPYCLFNPISAGLGSKACAACSGLLSIDSQGNVLPCSSLPDPVGSLLHDDFETVWNSEKARFYRECRHAPEACQGCSSFEICSGACPIYWNAFGCEEIGPGASSASSCSWGNSRGADPGAGMRDEYAG